MRNKRVLSKIDLGTYSKPNPYKNDIIKDPAGQWKYPGKPTRIESDNITMQGVNYPVFAVTDKGQKQMMQPGKNYNFPGAKYVDEYPQMKKGGGLNSQKYTRSLEGQSLLFRESELFKKPKSKKKKLFHSNAKYYQDGGPTDPPMSFYDYALAERQRLMAMPEAWKGDPDFENPDGTFNLCIDCLNPNYENEQDLRDMNRLIEEGYTREIPHYGKDQYMAGLTKYNIGVPLPGSKVVKSTEETKQYQNGGESGCPPGYAFNPVTGECIEWNPTVWESEEEPTSFDPVGDVIYMNPNDRPEGMSDEEYAQMYQDQLEHEQLHRLQWKNGDLKGHSGTPLRMPSTVDNQQYDGEHYYNRRGEEEAYLHDIWNQRHPDLKKFIPEDIVYNNEINPVMYDIPWTEEGEARGYEGALHNGMESLFPKRQKGGQPTRAYYDDSKDAWVYTNGTVGPNGPANFQDGGAPVNTSGPRNETEENIIPEGTEMSPDYDLRSFYIEQPMMAESFMAGNGHATDEYKLPNHPTFSTESRYSTTENPGGSWNQNADSGWRFNASHANRQNMSKEDLQNYFDEAEPGNTLNYVETDLTPKERLKGKYQNGGVVVLDGFQYKNDGKGNWYTISGAPIKDQTLVQRLSYEAKPLNAPVQEAPGRLQAKQTIVNASKNVKPKPIQKQISKANIADATAVNIPDYVQRPSFLDIPKPAEALEAQKKEAQKLINSGVAKDLGVVNKYLSKSNTNSKSPRTLEQLMLEEMSQKGFDDKLNKAYLNREYKNYNDASTLGKIGDVTRSFLADPITGMPITRKRAKDYWYSQMKQMNDKGIPKAGKIYGPGRDQYFYNEPEINPMNSPIFILRKNGGDVSKLSRFTN